MRLDTSAVAAGIGLVALDTVDSTNAQALRYGNEGERGPLWVTAQTQSAGRGRRGRTWVSEPGNLYASLLMSDPAPPPQVAQCSFVTAVAVHDAITEVAPALKSRLTLKWPNDVLCQSRKLAGILIEGEGREPMLVAAGIGINCRHHPDDAIYPATNLAAEGVAVSVPEMFLALAHHMVERLVQWNGGSGFAAIRAAWLERGPAPGSGLRVRLSEGEVTGRFATIDEEGNLILTKIDGSRRRITAGDVFPLSPAGPVRRGIVPPGRQPR